MSKVNSNYGCSQQTLYTAAALVWTSYAANLTAFTGLKGKYTKDYATAAVAAIAAAKALPASHARNAIPESIRIQLVPLGLNCLSNQRKLKSYIHEVFPGDAATPMLAAAGFNAYPAAFHEGWEEMNTMITAADFFIAQNTVALKAGTTNMPDAFISAYSTDKTAFETVYNNYIISSQATAGGTVDKVTANNAVYANLIAMMEDGRLIFEADKTRKELFTFSIVVNNITGNGTTGMHITAVDSISKKHIPGFTASVQPGDESGQATSDILEFKMSAGTYTVVIMAPGFSDKIIENVQLTTGVMHRLDVVLTKK